MMKVEAAAKWREMQLPTQRRVVASMPKRLLADSLTDLTTNGLGLAFLALQLFSYLRAECGAAPQAQRFLLYNQLRNQLCCPRRRQLCCRLRDGSLRIEGLCHKLSPALQLSRHQLHRPCRPRGPRVPHTTPLLRAICQRRRRRQLCRLHQLRAASDTHKLSSRVAHQQVQA